MSSIFTIDGVGYRVQLPEEGLKRSGAVYDGSNAGRLQSGSTVFDTVGTYFNYTIGPITPDPEHREDYDKLYEVVMSPSKREHTVVMPFGQSTISFRAYVANGEDTLKRRKNGVNYWTGLEIQCTAVSPYLYP
jgi:hypothetical protein